jgi:hypothetical protein
MRATKKRASRSTRPVAVDTAPLILTQDEKRLIAFYRAVRNNQQSMLLGMSEDYARIYPRHTRPTLCLVGGGAA